MASSGEYIGGGDGGGSGSGSGREGVADSTAVRDLREQLGAEKKRSSEMQTVFDKQSSDNEKVSCHAEVDI